MTDFSAVEARTARAVVYRLSNRRCTIGASDAAVPVIFDDGHVPQEIGGLVLEATGPRFVAVTGDLPRPVTGESVVMADGSVFVIREHRPSGTGTSLCLLHEA